jgi:hypothetical protein
MNIKKLTSALLVAGLSITGITYAQADSDVVRYKTVEINDVEIF